MACNARILKRNLADPYWKPNLPVISSFLWGTQILEENLRKTRLDSHGVQKKINRASNCQETSCEKKENNRTVNQHGSCLLDKCFGSPPIGTVLLFPIRSYLLLGVGSADLLRPVWQRQPKNSLAEDIV